MTASDALARIRAVGGLAARFVATPPPTRLARLAESGGYRLKFPETVGNAVEAVIVNTGGGVAGGDRVSMDMVADAGARATLSTATAERIYRSSGIASTIAVDLRVAEDATFAWLPQATILFSGARLDRRISADVTSASRLILAETTVFGRIASGEDMREGGLHERWRVRRDGRLVFAEATRLEGAIASELLRPAVASGKRVVSLLVCLAPDVEERCDAVRDAVGHCDIEAGVSAWNGILVVRLLGARLDVVEFALSRALGALKLCTPPYVWPAPLQ